ncbi:F-actin-monooxygenase MICAL3 isoform X3 [Adelges cooleyi]|uniref:F-actin-monooxygenase MICAL3 isoform X3 n=1 Tax=Adelges cooleyi TaxID=133065 RepID=UPI00217F2A38|nr:F-actin-monooxygenase MICAL3 isoform X3 [Adelges cooleyi]
MMAGVNSVSTYDDNEPDSLSDSPERTNKADDDSDDKDSGDDGSLQGDIDTELSRRLHQSETLLAAESVHGATLDAAEDGHFADLEQLSNSNSGYQMQRDSTELLLLSEKHHAGETGSDRGSGSEAAAPVDKSDLDNDGPLSDNTSSGFEDGPTGGLVAVDGSDADRPCTEPSLEQPPRVFTRPVPADETDNVTELVFDTWTTVDEPTTQLHDQKDPADLQQESAELLDISAAAASDNQECFEINAPAITNSVVAEVVSERTTEQRKTVKKKSSTVNGESAATAVVKSKKTKKSKKSDEKENISVKKTYCDEANRKSSTVIPEEPVPASVPIDELKRNFVGAIDRQPSESALTNGCSKSSFGKFDQLEKKAILQQRSLDSDKSDVKQNGVARPEVNSVCKSCDKTVYAMEQIKAERQVWHKNCFRCTTCNKQLTLDIYSSHEGLLYCKPHFKELFQPKAVVEEDEPIKRKKPELIIRENQPTELPPDVVRASDKPDLGLEELSSLNVKSRYQAFENASVNGNGPVEKSPVSVKRSPSILSKMAKFKSKGMDVGVPNEALNGAFFEPSSSSDGENDEDDDGGEVTKNCISKEKPMSFDKMESVKRNWEMRREEMKEEHKQEIQNIRSKLFLGKQGKMKQMYEQAVAESERTGVKRDVNINKSEKAKVIKEKFERGETLNDDNENGEPDEANKTTNQDEDEMSVFEAGISKKSRSHFMELDANAAKTLQSPPISVAKKEFTPSKPITPMYNRQVSEDVVKSSDRIEDVTVETADVCSKFKFFETYKPPPAPKRQFRITPPREGQTKGESPERDIYRDPNVVRSEDPVDETAELVKSNTTSKMLSLFRQMEVAKQDVPEGPKPMKRFTPPPDYKESSGTESESDDEVSDSEEEESTGSEANGDVVKSSMKVEDEFLKNAQNAVKAKSLKEKFEHWEPEKHSINNAVTMLDSEQESIESTKSLLARFESLKAERPAEKPKPKVNRFVQQSESIVLCESCEKKVYPLEKVEIEGRPFHRTCFKCTQCQCVLRMDTFTWNNNKLYCLPHFKRLFISKGNYDEGFGGNQHKKKWETNGHHAPQPQVVDRPSN